MVEGVVVGASLVPGVDDTAANLAFTTLSIRASCSAEKVAPPAAVDAGVAVEADSPLSDILRKNKEKKKKKATATLVRLELAGV